MPATETQPRATNAQAPRPTRGRLPLGWLRRDHAPSGSHGSLSHNRRARYGLRDDGFNPTVFLSACPALRLRDDESTHAPYVTAAHRCGCVPEYAPDSVHQIVFCLTDSAHATCPRFDESRAVRPASDGALPARSSSSLLIRHWRAALAVAATSLTLVGVTITSAIAVPGTEEASPRVAAAGESAAVTPVAAAHDVASSDTVRVLEVPPASRAAPARASLPPDDGAEALAALYRAQLVRPPAAPSGLAPASQPLSYVVVSGDSLLGIAADFDIEVEALLAANALSIDDPIIVGQVLTIPGADPA